MLLFVSTVLCVLLILSFFRMYGMALRGNWPGTVPDPTNERKGLEMLEEAVVSSLKDLKTASDEDDRMSDTAILQAALYELGLAFMAGVGAPEDHIKVNGGYVGLASTLLTNHLIQAATYFQAAAELGDADAMQALGDALMAGRTSKKIKTGKPDKIKAAKWYRAAEEAGAQPIVGTSWIWKEKYGAVL